MTHIPEITPRATMRITPVRTPPEQLYIPAKEVAARLGGMDLKTLRSQTDRGLIPCIRLPSGHRRYPRALIEPVILAYEQSGGVPPKPTIRMTYVKGGDTGKQLRVSNAVRRAAAATNDPVDAAVRAFRDVTGRDVDPDVIRAALAAADAAAGRRPTRTRRTG